MHAMRVPMHGNESTLLAHRPGQVEFSVGDARSVLATLTRIIISGQLVALFFSAELLASFFFPLLLTNVERKRGKENGARSSAKKNIPKIVLSFTCRNRRIAT